MALVIDYTAMKPRKATMDKAGIAQCPQCGRLGKYRQMAGVMYYTHKAQRGGTMGDMRAVAIDECAVPVDDGAAERLRRYVLERQG